MSAHRLHTLDIPAPAPAQPPQGHKPAHRPAGAFLAAVLIAFLLMLFGLHGYFQLAGAGVTVQPVRAGSALPVALGVIEQQTASEARVDGWRAGFAAGVEQGCTQPLVLSSPIATR
jgi:hypothetical protein